MNISSQARALVRGFTPEDLIGLLGLDRNEDGAVSVGEIRADVEEHLSAFNEQMNAFFSESGNKTRASGVFYTTNQEFPVFVNLFHPFVVLLHQTTVNQVTRPRRAARA